MAPNGDCGFCSRRPASNNAGAAHVTSWARFGRVLVALVHFQRRLMGWRDSYRAPAVRAALRTLDLAV